MSAPRPFQKKGFHRTSFCAAFLVAACAPGLAGTVQNVSSQDQSVFEIFAGQQCEVIARTRAGAQTSFSRDCRLLENLAKGTTPACMAPATAKSDAFLPVEARFPGHGETMFLCAQGRAPLGLEGKSSVRFAVLGDFGAGEDDAAGTKQVSVAKRLGEECFERAGAAPCDFVVTVGDNIYPDGAPDVFSSLFQERFEEPYRRIPALPFFLVPGNHDYHGNVQAQVEYTYFSRRWRMEKRNYALGGLPPWLGIQMLDSTPLERSGADKGQRRKETISALCAARWRFLLGHHPIASSGHHGPSQKARSFFQEVNAACPGVIQVSGHEHHQEYIYGEGIHQIIQGAGGAVVKAITPGLYGHDPAAGRLHFAASEHGFALVEASRTQLTFSYYGLSRIAPLWTCTLSDPLATPRCSAGH